MYFTEVRGTAVMGSEAPAGPSFAMAPRSSNPAEAAIPSLNAALGKA
jgi:hypothetical protein